MAGCTGTDGSALPWSPCSGQRTNKQISKVIHSMSDDAGPPEIMWGLWAGQGASGELRELLGQEPGHVCRRGLGQPAASRFTRAPPSWPCRQRGCGPASPSLRPRPWSVLAQASPASCAPSLLPTLTASSPFCPVGGPPREQPAPSCVGRELADALVWGLGCRDPPRGSRVLPEGRRGRLGGLPVLGGGGRQSQAQRRSASSEQSHSRQRPRGAGRAAPHLHLQGAERLGKGHGQKRQSLTLLLDGHVTLGVSSVSG